MRIHLVGIFHTIHSSEYSHCAFTGKAMRFSKMLGEHYDIIEYANEGSESVSCTHEQMLTRAEVAQHYPREAHEFIGKHAVVGSPGWSLFNDRLTTAIRRSVKAGDIVAHPFGQAHTGLVQAIPQAAHLETGIGYPDVPFGAWRIFESEAWRHYHWGKHERDHWQDSGMNREFSWVIPNYYDLSDWDVSDSPKGYSPILGDTGWRHGKPYVIYMGRIDPNKGAVAAAVIARTWFEKYPRSDLGFLFAGQGDFGIVQSESKLGPDKIGYLGPVSGRIRSLIQGNARANIMPTRFIEPFGGSGVEGQMCGTPLIATDSGAFTETVTPGVNGYRCKTLGDWIWALEHVEALDRERIALDARKRYSLATCRDQYIKAIECVGELCSGTGKGWTSARSYALDSAGITRPGWEGTRNPPVTVLPAEIQAKVTENLANRVADLKAEKDKLVEVIREMKKAEMVTSDMPSPVRIQHTPITEEDHKALGVKRKLPARTHVDPFDTVKPELLSTGTTRIYCNKCGGFMATDDHDGCTKGSCLIFIPVSQRGAEGSSTPIETPTGANGSGATFTPEPSTNPATPVALTELEQAGIERAKARIAARSAGNFKSDYQKRLLDDATFRGEEVRRLMSAPIAQANRASPQALLLDAMNAEKARHDAFEEQQKVARDRAFEASYWGDCINTHEEEEKHYVYARLMGLTTSTVPNRAGYYTFGAPSWPTGITILDIGGGPVSMLLKASPLKQGYVVDPTKYPEWVKNRYAAKDIQLIEAEGEELIQAGNFGTLEYFPSCDEVWIYNVLQHVRDPQLIIQNALRAAPVLRLFEWIDIPPHEGHPHELSSARMLAWLGERGILAARIPGRVGISQLNERGCVGRAFYGVF